jgi:hypothetical protein
MVSQKCSTILAQRRLPVFSFQHENSGWMVDVCACNGVTQRSRSQTTCRRIREMDAREATGGSDESTPVDMKVRPLFVDGRTKEFTTGAAHDVTERLFVVQRAYRLNDQLPQEAGPNRWRWERGGWLLVDRVSGRVQPVALPAFDAYFSDVTWFRDYAAYCGASDDGKKLFTVVAQLGKRKALLKKVIGESGGDPPEKTCHAPSWLRAPARVTFNAAGEQKFTFTVRSHDVDLVTDDEDEGGD